MEVNDVDGMFINDEGVVTGSLSVKKTITSKDVISKYNQINPIKKVSGCPLVSRCPIIKNGGIRCTDNVDCKTFDYISNGLMHLD